MVIIVYVQYYINFSDWYFKHLLLKSHPTNATGPQFWIIKIGLGNGRQQAIIWTNIGWPSFEMPNGVIVCGKQFSYITEEIDTSMGCLKPDTTQLQKWISSEY